MILYFDSYITDIPFNKHFVDSNKKIREACQAYTMPSKLDIAKYTLASYALYPWTNVLIRYEIDDQNQYAEFDSYIKQLFPQAIIMHERSDSQEDFKKSLDIISSFNDEWIFYSGNNDHPITSADISHLHKILQDAQKYTDEYPFISIPYSHLSEYVNLPKKGNPSYLVIGLDSEIISDNDLYTVVLKKEGEYSSVQILNKNLFTHWLTSKDLTGERIIRTEDVRIHVATSNQLMLIPKKEICAHFDGYSHTHRGINEITPSQVPPLFIPNRFFDSNIKIAYGYEDYREGWTNINPIAKKYSFEDSTFGTDLKITLEDIPLFWKNRIKEIDINKKLNAAAVVKYNKKNTSIINNPWKFGNRKIDFSYIMFLLRNIKFRLKHRKI